MSERFAHSFGRAAAENRAALITYIMAQDPDRRTSQAILDGLPEAGADIIELGMPFSDPTADGPTIQEASWRSLKAGGSVKTTLEMVRHFRQKNTHTPIVLMGYFNPILHYGLDAFVTDAREAGIDGLIMVDLPPEEERQLTCLLEPAGLSLIKLTTPTTDEARADVILNAASGFVYYVSVAGITGTTSADAADIEAKVAMLKRKSNLPVAVGFGIKTPEQASAVAAVADGIVVGSALVQKIKDDPANAADQIHALVRKLHAATSRLATPARQSGT